MRAWRLVALSLAMALPLSGCVDEAPQDDGVTVVTDPRDFTYLQNGTDAGFHLHDYWGGQDRVQVLDEERSFTFNVGGGSYSSTSFLPPDGAVVPQGTASVETVLDWTDNQPEATRGGLQLWVRTQNMSQPVLVGDATRGGTLTFTATHADADLPHQVLSAWEFFVRVLTPPGQPSNPATGNVRSFDIDLTITVTAVRGLDLPLFPPHPDHWGNATALPLVEGRTGTTFFWLNEPPSCGYCSGGVYVVHADNGSLVPPGAAVVEVILAAEADTPTGLRLLYHGADTREWAEAPVASEGPDGRVHVIPVDGRADGPYSAQSLWAFYFAYEGGDGPYRGEWSLSARVLRESP